MDSPNNDIVEAFMRLVGRRAQTFPIPFPKWLRSDLSVEALSRSFVGTFVQVAIHIEGSSHRSKEILDVGSGEAMGEIMAVDANLLGLAGRRAELGVGESVETSDEIPGRASGRQATCPK